MIAYSLMCPWVIAVNIWLGRTKGFHRNSAFYLCLELLKQNTVNLNFLFWSYCFDLLIIQENLLQLCCNPSAILCHILIHFKFAWFCFFCLLSIFTDITDAYYIHA